MVFLGREKNGMESLIPDSLCAYIHAQQSKFTPIVFEALTALLAINDELPPETRLGIALSIQSQYNVPPKIRPRLAQLCYRLMS